MRGLFPSTILIILIYVPGVWQGIGLPTFHIEDLFIVVGSVVSFIRKQKKVTELITHTVWKTFVLTYIIFLFWINIITLLHPLSPEDADYFYSGLFKGISMLRPLCFLIILIDHIQDNQSIKVIMFTIMIIGIIQIPIFVLQKYDLFDINLWLTPKYSLVFETSIYSIAGFRTDGTFGNPNHAAVAMAPIGSLFFSYYLFGKTTKLGRILSLIMTLLMFFSILVLTQSRAGLSTMVASICILQSLAFWEKKSRATLSLLLLFFCTLFILPYLLRNDQGIQDQVIDRFEIFKSADKIKDDSSFSTRMEVWNESIQSLDRDIWTGKGLASYVKAGFFDSGYVDYAFTGGVILVLLYIFMCFSVSNKLFKYIRKNSGNENIYVCAAGCGVTISLLVVAISHPILYSDKLWLNYFTIITCAHIIMDKTEK